MGGVLLWFGAGGRWSDKTIAGTSFHLLSQPAGMMDKTDVSISKVLGPSSSSSSMASNGFSKALTDVGAAVMGVGIWAAGARWFGVGGSVFVPPTLWSWR